MNGRFKCSWQGHLRVRDFQYFESLNIVREHCKCGKFVRVMSGDAFLTENGEAAFANPVKVINDIV